MSQGKTIILKLNYAQSNNPTLHPSPSELTVVRIAPPPRLLLRPPPLRRHCPPAVSHRWRQRPGGGVLPSPTSSPPPRPGERLRECGKAVDAAVAEVATMVWVAD